MILKPNSQAIFMTKGKSIVFPVEVTTGITVANRTLNRL